MGRGILSWFCCASAVVLAGYVPDSYAAPAAGPTASLTLRWTAPGDDGRIGVASRYDLRFSLHPISESSFASATAVPGVPRPSRAGTKETVEVRDLVPETDYYFALKTVDNAGNWSRLSNVLRHTAPGQPTPLPASIALSAPQPNPSREATSFQLALPRDAEVSIRVFDAGGRDVVILADGHYPAGVTTLWWTLRDSRGLPVGSGRYWICGRVDGTQLVRSVAVVR
jgi:hypothetical protein